MSAYPLMLDGNAISAVIIGGGSVAVRKAKGLRAAGARVHVIAPEISRDLELLASADESLRITRANFSPEHVEGATLVIAATNDAVVNESVAAAAHRAGILVNVAGAPDLGNCITPATHRSGDVVIAVSTGGVPAAAARIRDAIAESIDGRYADAVRDLAVLRRGLLAAGRRDRWLAASSALVGPEFRTQVESGAIAARIAEWR